MTIIAWDGKTLAADKRVNFGGMLLTTTKIRRIGNMLVGYAGNADFGEQMLAWIREGMDPEKFPEGQRNKDDWSGVIAISPGGYIRRYERTPYPIVFEDPFVAIGSGRDFAMAAMHLGHDARKAVEVACALNADCGGGIDVLTLETE